jgi:chemotaxis protein histidine kinase CheA
LILHVSCKKLEELNLSYNRIRFLDPLPTTLTMLDISCNWIDSPTTFRTLSRNHRLHTLDISGNHVANVKNIEWNIKTLVPGLLKCQIIYDRMLVKRRTSPKFKHPPATHSPSTSTNQYAYQHQQHQQQHHHHHQPAQEYAQQQQQQQQQQPPQQNYSQPPQQHQQHQQQAYQQQAPQQQHSQQPQQQQQQQQQHHPHQQQQHNNSNQYAVALVEGQGVRSYYADNNFNNNNFGQQNNPYQNQYPGNQSNMYNAPNNFNSGSSGNNAFGSNQNGINNSPSGGKLSDQQFAQLQQMLSQLQTGVVQV